MMEIKSLSMHSLQQLQKIKKCTVLMNIVMRSAIQNSCISIKRSLVIVKSTHAR